LVFFPVQSPALLATFFPYTTLFRSRIFDETFMKEKFATVDRMKEGQISDVHSAQKMQPAPSLFDLTELQKEAHRRWSWSAKETLSTLQNLYERHKIVTYPRTDSKHLSSDMKETLIERVKAVDIPPFRKAAQQLIRQGKLQPQKGVIDDKRVSDHHAIIPTEETALLQDLSDKEK